VIDSGGIYIIENTGNGMKYIGMASSLADRKYLHFYQLERNEHPNSHMQDDYNKWGSGYFNFSILIRSNNRKARKIAESALIKFSDSDSLYNMIKHNGVFQADLQTGEIIAAYNGLGDAERQTGIPRWAIQSCTRNGGGMTGGYYWTTDGHWLQDQKEFADPFGLNKETRHEDGTWHRIENNHWDAYRRKIAYSSSMGYIRISQSDGTAFVYSDVRPSKRQFLESVSQLPFSVVFAKVGHITKTGVFAK
jgi:hypothetical protein